MYECAGALPVDDADVTEAVLRWLYAEVVKYCPSRDVNPAATAFYKFFAGNRMTVEIPTAWLRIPPMNEKNRDSGEQLQ
jgi:hypothetical protein